MRRLGLMVVVAAVAIALGAGAAAQQRVDKGNMELVGYDDLQGRSAYQPVIHKQGNRWILYMGHHTVMPLFGVPVEGFQTQHVQRGGGGGGGEEGSRNFVTKRDFVAVIGEESGNECTGERQMVRFVDVTTETKMTGVSTFTVPDSLGFCGRGGRFGPHSSNENMTPIYYDRVLFIAYFNAGVRAVDVRDPYHPKEIGYFIPAATSRTSQQCLGRGANAPCKVQIQTNNVEVDDRGYIYIADRGNTGVHILELTGAARKVARFPS